MRLVPPASRSLAWIFGAPWRSTHATGRQFVTSPETSRTRFRDIRRSMATAVTETTDKDGKTVRIVREGKATILVPQSAEVKGNRDQVQQVFYNPIQQYNRDLSILAIKTFGEQSLRSKLQAYQSSKNRLSKKRKRDQSEPQKDSEEAKTEPVQAEKAEKENQEDQNGTTSHKPTFKILDALSASGLRALRYGHELPFVTSITANDLSPTAAESIRENVKQNGLEQTIHVTEGDALAVMYRAIADDLDRPDIKGQPSKQAKFDVIDLDPYGSAAPFFDAAVQAVRDDGGLLAVTCTDSALWAGHCYTEKSYALYGGVPAKGLHSHEAGLRLIIHAIATSAARYGLHIEPLLSLSIDYYTKVFLKVTKSALAVKFHGSKSMLAYTCDSGCGSWEMQPILKAKLTETKNGKGLFYKHGMHLGPTSDSHCRHCGSKMHISGPMYGGRIHSKEFVESLLNQIPQADASTYQTLPRLEGMLGNVLEEFLEEPEVKDERMPKEAVYAAIDPYPFFFMPSKLASVLSSVTPPEDMIRGALVHLGYRVGTSHCRAGSIKTNAPWPTIWWVFVQYVRQKAPIKTEKLKPTMPAWKILKDMGYFDNDNAKPEESEKAATDGDTTMGGERDGPVESVETAEGDSQQVPFKEMELRKTLIFDDELAKLGKKSKPQGVVRYQTNPHAYWGPLSKASAR